MHFGLYNTNCPEFNMNGIFLGFLRVMVATRGLKEQFSKTFSFLINPLAPMKKKRKKRE
jgi:hypothetical protein